MTAYVAAVHRLLWPRLARRAALRAADRRQGPPATPAPAAVDIAGTSETPPMLYRSEGFAEDLLDLYPSC